MKPCFNESSLQLVRLCQAFLQEIALFPVKIISEILFDTKLGQILFIITKKNTKFLIKFITKFNNNIRIFFIYLYD